MAVKNEKMSEGRRRAWERQRRDLFLGKMLKDLLTAEEYEIVMRRAEAMLRGEKWPPENAVRNYGGRP